MRLSRRGSAADALAECRRLLDQGLPEEYLAFTERASAQFPSDADVRLEYATALVASRPKQAGVEALDAVELDGREDAVRLSRAASLLVSARQLDAARSCAERAARAAPALSAPVSTVIESELFRVRGEIAALEDDYALAERELRSGHEITPGDPSIARDLAAVLAGGRRFDEALPVIDRTLDAPPISGAGAARSRHNLRELRERIEADRRSLGESGTADG